MKMRIMVGLIKICVNMDEEKNRGKRREKRRGKAGGKKKRREKNQLTLGGSHKQLKNIEWWQVSDGAKRVWYFQTMSDEW